MSCYYNEAGEPIMTASQARHEALLDEQSRDDYWQNEQEADENYWEYMQARFGDAQEEDNEEDNDQDPAEDFGYFGEMGAMED